MLLQSRESAFTSSDSPSLTGVARTSGSILLSGPSAPERLLLARGVHVQRGHSLDSFLWLDWTEISGLTTLPEGRWKTVYLDNVDRLGPDDQTGLSCYLESGDRSGIIAGAADLWTDVQKGSFSEALFYRLNVIHVVGPLPDVIRPGHTSEPALACK